MTSRFTSVLRAVALIGVAVSLSACVVSPYGGGYRHHGGGYGGGYGGYRPAPSYHAQPMLFGRGPNGGGGGWGGGGWRRGGNWR